MRRAVRTAAEVAADDAYEQACTAFAQATANVQASQSDLEFARKQRGRAEDTWVTAHRLLRLAEDNAGRGPGGVFLRFEEVTPEEHDASGGEFIATRVADDIPDGPEVPGDRPGLSSI